MRPSNRAVLITCLAILAFGVITVVSGYADPSALLGVAVLDGLILGLLVAFRGSVEADVASFASEMGATVRRRAWQRAMHWLLILVLGIVTLDVVVQGLSGAMPQWTTLGLALAGLFSIILFVFAARRLRTSKE